MSLLPQPIVNTEAVVLRVWPSGETSILASLLCAEVGFVRVIAKAARTNRSRTRALVQPGCLVQVEFSDAPGREVQFLRSGTVVLDPFARDATLEGHAYLLAALEIVDRCRLSGLEAGGLFDLCHDFIQVLSCAACGTESSLFYALELALLQGLGMAPELTNCTGCGRSLLVADEPVVEGQSPAQPPPAEGAIWFRDAVGGVLCDDCAGTAEGAGARSLTPEVWLSLISLSSSATEGWPPVILPRPVARGIGITLHRFLGYHLPGYRLPAALDLLRSR